MIRTFGLQRPRRLAPAEYEKAIEDIRLAMTQLEPDGRCCVVCGDSDHQAWECHHNPVAVKNEFEADKLRWRCFHCGELFTDEALAREHFGPHTADAPACVADAVEVVIRYPNGQGSSRLTVRNDRTGTPSLGNYVCEFYATMPEHGPDERRVTSWRMEKFQRWLGIEALVSAALEVFADASASARDPATPVKDTILGGTLPAEAGVVDPSPTERADALLRLIRHAWNELREIYKAHPEAVNPPDAKKAGGGA